MFTTTNHYILKWSLSSFVLLYIGMKSRCQVQHGVHLDGGEFDGNNMAQLANQTV